jgi:hypothetical protein
MRRTRLTGVAAATVAAVALAGGAAASGAGVSGTEHFTFVTTGSSNHFSAILTGAFDDGGTAILPGQGRGTIKLQQGTIYAHPTSKSKPQMTFNRKDCFSTYRQSGTVVVTGGTGAYAGITGHGTYTSAGEFVGPIVNGRCDTSNSAKAVATQFEISGTLTLG